MALQNNIPTISAMDFLTPSGKWNAGTASPGSESRVTKEQPSADEPTVEMTQEELAEMQRRDAERG